MLDLLNTHIKFLNNVWRFIRIIMNYFVQERKQRIFFFFSVFSISHILSLMRLCCSIIPYVKYYVIGPWSVQRLRKCAFALVHYRFDLEESVYFGVHCIVVPLSREGYDPLWNIAKYDLSNKWRYISKGRVLVIAIITPCDRLPICDTHCQRH